MLPSLRPSFPDMAAGVGNGVWCHSSLLWLAVVAEVVVNHCAKDNRFVELAPL